MNKIAFQFAGIAVINKSLIKPRFLHEAANFWFRFVRSMQRIKFKVNQLACIYLMMFILYNLRAKGLRLQNIYDVNSKTFLLKFQKASIDKSENSSEAMPFATFDAAKTLILIESGIRLHLTQFERDKADFPNGFVIKVFQHRFKAVFK